MNRRPCVSVILLFVACWSAVAIDGPGEMRERILAPLRSAGIEISEPSLMKTLKHEDKALAARAALALGTLPKTQRIVTALNGAIDDQDESVVVSAASSLLAFREKGWTVRAAERLPSVQNPVTQLLLARYLAQAGNVAGWRHVVLAITGAKWAPTALEGIEYFDNKKKSDGQIIDVVKELQILEGQVTPVVADQIRAKLGQLRSKKMK